MMPSQSAQQAATFMAGRAPAGIAGCPGCTGPDGTPMLKDVAPLTWWTRIPLWAKIAGGIVLAGGVGLLLYRVSRR